MQCNDKAIALHSVRYGESSLIVYLYTLENGRTTLMVNRAFTSGKKAGKAALFQPLTLLKVLYYPSRRGGMGRFKEASLQTHFSSIPYNQTKRSIALFMSEVIYRMVREEEGNPILFEFIESSIEFLDNLSQSGVANFHLAFLTQMSRYLGFFPSGSYSEGQCFFNIKSGHFETEQPFHPQYLQGTNARLLDHFTKKGYKDLETIELSGKQRTNYLEDLLGYFNFHLGGSITINSFQVLPDVFVT